MIARLTIGLLACASPPGATDLDSSAADTGGAGDSDTPPTPPRPVEASGDLVGPCEASALVPWKGGWLVSDNETSTELYAFDADFAPLAGLPLAVEVVDIEALAVQDGGVWVVGSNSTTAEGVVKPKRDRVVRPDGEILALDLAACPRCEQFRGVPTDQGGLNIEGAAWRDERLWLGLRAPLTEAGETILLAMDADGRVDRVLALDLGGAGVRALTPEGDGLLVVTGPTLSGESPHRLWRLATLAGAPTPLPVALPPDTEGAALHPDAPDLLVYVTDGAGLPGACTTPATWGRVYF